ncbi:MAG: TM2 domain-containing protein [Akkermansia sp.]|nr:TM2 domain-containing protein [Akkermansia sp.]
MQNTISPCSRTATLLLSFFMIFGICGLHRFYAGKVFTGILQLITVGFFGIWQVIDIVRIIFGAFSDSEGRPIIR